MPKPLDKASVSALWKLIVFMIVTAIATTLLAITIGNISFEDRVSYRAEFSDATGVIPGDDVRISGVRVGTVADVQIEDRTTAVVTLDVDTDVTLTVGTEATIKYRNLIGQRYIALDPGASDEQTALETDAVIPLDRTNDALDLTVLFNGFKPLFRALSPQQTNKLATEIVQVLQGESGTVESLLKRTASVTQTFADRDRLIGRILVNFNDVLGTLNNRDRQLSQSILTLQQFVSGLNDDRDAITSALGSISRLTEQTAGLVGDARPALTADIESLRSFSDQLNTDAAKGQLDDILKILPTKLDAVGATLTQGSFGGVFLCESTSDITVPPIQQIPGYATTQTFLSPEPIRAAAPRCNQ